METKSTTSLTTMKILSEGQLIISREAAADSIALAMREKIYNPADCFRKEFLTVGQMRKDPEAASQLSDYIRLCVVQANEFLGLTEQMGEMQVELTVDMI